WEPRRLQRWEHLSPEPSPEPTRSVAAPSLAPPWRSNSTITSFVPTQYGSSTWIIRTPATTTTIRLLARHLDRAQVLSAAHRSAVPYSESKATRSALSTPQRACL